MSAAMQEEREQPEEGQVERRDPFSGDKLRCAFLACMRRPDVFVAVEQFLTPEAFHETERAYRVIWMAINKFFAQFDRGPSILDLGGEVADFVKSDDATPEDVAEIERLLAEARRYEVHELDPALALTYLKEFLEDRLQEEIGATFQQGEQTPKDMVRLLRAAQSKACDLRILTSSPSRLPFPENRPLKSIKLVPTGVAWLDAMLGGGQAAGELYLFMGPYGGGKTVLAIQGAIASAKRLWDRWDQDGRQGPMPVVYSAFYEESPFLFRALAQEATIPLSRLGSVDDEAMSTSDDLEAYEQEMFAESLRLGLPVPGEQERLARAHEVCNRNWRIVDFSGNDPPRPGWGAACTTSCWRSSRRTWPATRSRTGLPQSAQDASSSTMRSPPCNCTATFNRFPLVSERTTSASTRPTSNVISSRSTSAPAGSSTSSTRRGRR